MPSCTCMYAKQHRHAHVNRDTDARTQGALQWSRVSECVERMYTYMCVYIYILYYIIYIYIYIYEWVGEYMCNACV